MTKTEQLRRGLLSHGAKLVENQRSSKYEVYEVQLDPVTVRDPSTGDACLIQGMTRYVFLGKAGALRWSTSQRVDSTYQVPSSFLKMILAKGK